MLGYNISASTFWMIFEYHLAYLPMRKTQICPPEIPLEVSLHSEIKWTTVETPVCRNILRWTKFARHSKYACACTGGYIYIGVFMRVYLICSNSAYMSYNMSASVVLQYVSTHLTDFKYQPQLCFQATCGFSGRFRKQILFQSATIRELKNANLEFANWDKI